MENLILILFMTRLTWIVVKESFNCRRFHVVNNDGLCLCHCETTAVRRQLQNNTRHSL